MSDLISRHIIKEQMLKYGFAAPDITVTEFVEDCLPSSRNEFSLPEGYGRLIDADALAAQFKKQIEKEDDLMELCKRAGLMINHFNESKVQIGMITFLRMLNDAKTIVPAEGGGTMAELKPCPFCGGE